MRRAFPTLAFVLLSSPAFAQFGGVVFDPQNFAKNTITAVQSKAMVDQLVEMSARLPKMDRYKLPGPEPPPPWVPNRLEYVIRWYADQYYQKLHPLIAARVPGIEIIDEIVWRAQHHALSSRNWDVFDKVVGILEGDVTGPSPARSLTAAIDAMNASQLIARKQEENQQRLMTSLVEVGTVKAEEVRDSAWANLMMRAGFLATPDYGDTTSWARWRQP